MPQFENIFKTFICEFLSLSCIFIYQISNTIKFWMIKIILSKNISGKVSISIKLIFIHVCMNSSIIYVMLIWIATCTEYVHRYSDAIFSNFYTKLFMTITSDNSVWKLVFKMSLTTFKRNNYRAKLFYHYWLKNNQC